MKKIAFVVQRYGAEVNGGSEQYCRQVAEQLTPFYDVTVLTSCAQDYTTWENTYPEGDSDLNGVHVKRFATDFQRVPDEFNALTGQVLSPENLANYDMGIDWQRAQGPHCPGLLRHIAENREAYSAILFMTYLYSPSYFGIHIAPQRSILIPTAHDEPPIYQCIFNSEFHLPKYIIYNAPAEKEFVQNHFGNAHIPSCVAGLGIDIKESLLPPSLRLKFGISGDYMVYVGRIDVEKGCAELIDYFNRMKAETSHKLKLVLVGKANMEIPKQDDIIATGFVSDKEKIQLIRKAKMLVLPSYYESLSMSTLEAMYLKVPVLVNGNCAVLKGHITQSGGGACYHSYEEFAQQTTALLTAPDGGKGMGEKGHAYVQANYSWQAILEKFKTAIEHVAAL